MMLKGSWSSRNTFSSEPSWGPASPSDGLRSPGRREDGHGAACSGAATLAPGRGKSRGCSPPGAHSLFPGVSRLLTMRLLFSLPRGLPVSCKARLTRRFMSSKRCSSQFCRPAAQEQGAPCGLRAAASQRPRPARSRPFQGAPPSRPHRLPKASPPTRQLGLGLHRASLGNTPPPVRCGLPLRHFCELGRCGRRPQTVTYETAAKLASSKIEPVSLRSGSCVRVGGLRHHRQDHLDNADAYEPEACG